MASRVDIDEAMMVGGAAVKAADEGDTGKMVVIDRVSDVYKRQPLYKAADRYSPTSRELQKEYSISPANQRSYPESWFSLV